MPLKKEVAHIAAHHVAFTAFTVGYFSDFVKYVEVDFFCDVHSCNIS